MKILCTQENLHNGLCITGHFLGKHNSLPILGNVLLKAQGNSISFTTTNLEIGIEATIRGKIEEEGSFTVDAKIFSEYISLLPKENVEITTINNELEIKTSKTQTRMKGLPSDEFPLLPEVEKKTSFTFSSMDFKKALSQVIFAVSHDEIRVELTGVLFSFEKEKLILAATDSYRLTEKQFFYKSDIQEGIHIIVPLKSVTEMIRILSGEDCILYCSQNQISLLNNGAHFISRIIDGNYPDYKQLIPEKRNTKIIVNRSEFLTQIRTAGLFCRPGINDVHLKFSPEKKAIIIASINAQLGENISELDAQISGDENEIVFNYRYLLDGLNSISTNEVVLEIIDKNNIGLLRPKDESDYLYLIMPIRQ